MDHMTHCFTESIRIYLVYQFQSVCMSKGKLDKNTMNLYMKISLDKPAVWMAAL